MIQEEHKWKQEEYEDIGQWENWENLLDMCNAIRYGFSQYRLPTPGKAIDIQEARGRVKHIDKEWEHEYRTRGDESQKSSPNFSQCSIEAQCYFHTVLVSNEPDIEEFNFPYLAY